MTKEGRNAIERNTITVNNSHLTSSALVSGSRAQVSLSEGTDHPDHEANRAVIALRQELIDAQASMDRRDDELRERLDLAISRLGALEEEMHVAQDTRDWDRIKKLVTVLREGLAGLTSLTLGADALRDAIESIAQ